VNEALTFFQPSGEGVELRLKVVRVDSYFNRVLIPIIVLFYRSLAVLANHRAAPGAHSTKKNLS